MIFGIRRVFLPALFNFTYLDFLELYFMVNQPIKYRRYNVFWFVHIFFIPLIPIWYDGALWKVWYDRV